MTTPRPPFSIRTTLTLRWTLAFGLLLALAHSIIYVGFHSYASRDLDAQVRTLALTELASSTDADEVHIHEFPTDHLYAHEYADKFAQLFAEDGSLVRHSAGGPARPLVARELVARTFAGDSPVTTVEDGARRARVALVAGEKAGDRYVIAVGVYTDRLDASLSRLAWLLLTVWLVCVAITGGLGYGLASRALAPIDRITRQASSIAEGSYTTRLDVPQPDDEVGRMARLLNAMIDRLHRALEAHRRFASDASHELRSPLTAMLGEVDVALRRPRTTAEYRETLEVVRGQLHELVQLTEDLMLLCRAQEGRGDAAAPEVPLRRMLEHAVARVESDARRRHVSVMLEPESPELLVYGEERLLERVFDNLLANAVHYNRAGGTVVVRARIQCPAPGAWEAPAVIVEVEDTGTGIPRSAWDRVFERFHRLDASRSRRTGGAGLGLSIARAVTELYGGGVAIVRSSSEGTTFEVRLPGRSRRILEDALGTGEMGTGTFLRES